MTVASPSRSFWGRALERRPIWRVAAKLRWEILVALAYATSSLLGLVWNVTYFNEYGINYLDYANVTDFLFGFLRDAAIWLAFIIGILLVLCGDIITAATATAVAPPSYSKINRFIDFSFYFFGIPTVIVLSFIISYNSIRISALENIVRYQSYERSCVGCLTHRAKIRYPVCPTFSETIGPPDCIKNHYFMIGSTSNYVFLEKHMLFQNDDAVAGERTVFAVRREDLLALRSFSSADVVASVQTALEVTEKQE